MSYKLKSLTYLTCFVLAITIYYNLGDENTMNNQEIIDINKMDDNDDKLVIVNDLELE